MIKYIIWILLSSALIGASMSFELPLCIGIPSFVSFVIAIFGAIGYMVDNS